MSLLRISCVRQRGVNPLTRLSRGESWQNISPRHLFKTSISTPCSCYAVNNKPQIQLICLNQGTVLSKDISRLYSTSVKDKKHDDTDSVTQSSIEKSVDENTSKSVIFEAISTNTEQEEDVGEFNEHQYASAKFDGFYFLPQIPLVRLVCRLKLYQTFLTCCALPIFGGMLVIGTIPVATFAQMSGFAAFALAMLYAMTFYTSRLVGRMSLSEDGRALKIAHLTFWGKRNDVLHPVKDIVPLTELRGGEQLIKMEIRNSDEHYYFSKRYGRIQDLQKFVHVFGSSS